MSKEAGKQANAKADGQAAECTGKQADKAVGRQSGKRSRKQDTAQTAKQAAPSSFLSSLPRKRKGEQLIDSKAPESLQWRIAVSHEKRPRPLLPPKPAKPKKDKRHTATRVAFFRYGYYDPCFKYFTEQVLNAEFLPLPPATRRTEEVGTQNSTDYVCTPFKHILGDFVDALELGANVVVQFCGPCRLGYYGELQESILRDMGYDNFRMLNFANGLDTNSAVGWTRECLKQVNPDINVPKAALKLIPLTHMVAHMDSAYDFYLANAGFEQESGSFDLAWAAYMDAMAAASDEKTIQEAHAHGMERMRAIPLNKPENPIRIGIVGEMFTAFDPRSNLNLDKKLLAMGVEVHRMMNLTNRFVHYNEPNLRQSAREYITYDMGPTSTITIAAAKKFAAEGFDGLVHAKSAGCTPEIDCEPALMRIAEDYSIPVLYLTYDAQTSDTGLDTRLEAFYDMLTMKKQKGTLR